MHIFRSYFFSKCAIQFHFFNQIWNLFPSGPKATSFLFFSSLLFYTTIFTTEFFRVFVFPQRNLSNVKQGKLENLLSIDKLWQQKQNIFLKVIFLLFLNILPHFILTSFASQVSGCGEVFTRTQKPTTFSVTLYFPLFLPYKLQRSKKQEET